jgi:hypothetical protein
VAWERLRAVARAVRQQPYETAIGAASLTGVVELATGRGSSALSMVIPHWALHVLGAVIALGGAMTLAGLMLAAWTADEVRLVVARRVEQAGQIMISGVLVAIGVGAATYGVSSLIPGAVDLALGAASAARAAEIAATFRTVGRRAP